MTRWIILVAVLMGTTAARAEDADPLAFIVQQVCVDGGDHPVPGDPASCPRKRRLRVGEPIPTRRVDAGNWQAFAAYPVESVNGRPAAMVAKVFGGADTSGSFGDLGVRSGYDLLEVGEHYVSGIRTSDQGAGDQIFWRTPDCQRPDGWIFFPPGLRPGEHGEVKSTLKITKGPSVACPRSQLRNIAPDYTVWDFPLEPMRYTSGKVLPSIVSMHFAYGDPADRAHDNDSMEKFTFTEPYGYTRWEAWQTPQGCQKNAIRDGRDPAQTCQPYPQERCSGDNRAVYFGKLYLRLDCRDATFVRSGPERPFEPLVSDAAPGDVLSRNLLGNPTFFEGAAGWTAIPDARAEHEERTNNALLGLPAGARLTQDFVVPPEVAGPGRSGVLRWGATLLSAGPESRARLTLTLQGDGEPVTAEQVVTVGRGAVRTVRFAVPSERWPARLASGRIDVAAEGGEGLRVDDILVTPTGAGPDGP